MANLYIDEALTTGANNGTSAANAWRDIANMTGVTGTDIVYARRLKTRSTTLTLTAAMISGAITGMAQFICTNDLWLDDNVSHYTVASGMGATTDLVNLNGLNYVTFKNWGWQGATRDGIRGITGVSAHLIFQNCSAVSNSAVGINGTVSGSGWTLMVYLNCLAANNGLQGITTSTASQYIRCKAINNSSIGLTITSGSALDCLVIGGTIGISISSQLANVNGCIIVNASTASISTGASTLAIIRNNCFGNTASSGKGIAATTGWVLATNNTYYNCASANSVTTGSITELSRIDETEDIFRDSANGDYRLKSTVTGRRVPTDVGGDTLNQVFTTTGLSGEDMTSSVLEVTPNIKRLSGTTQVTIKLNPLSPKVLTGATGVTFGGTAATNLVPVDAQTMKVDAPDKAANLTAVDIVVTLADTTTITASKAFTYPDWAALNQVSIVETNDFEAGTQLVLTKLSPAYSISLSGSGWITIESTGGFGDPDTDGPLTVLFNGIEATQYKNQSDTHIEVGAPSSPITQNVDMTIINYKGDALTLEGVFGYFDFLSNAEDFETSRNDTLLPEILKFGEQVLNKNNTITGTFAGLPISPDNPEYIALENQRTDDLDPAILLENEQVKIKGQSIIGELEPGTLDLPLTPTGFAAFALDSTTNNISWNMVSVLGGPAATYELSHDGTTAFETGITALDFQEEDLSPDTTYSYYVRARNAAGASPWSLAVTAKTKATSTAYSLSKKQMIAWVRSVTGFDANHVIWANQDVTKPSKPYVTLRTTAFSTTGVAAVYEPNTSGVGKVLTHNEFTLSIRFYGNESNDPIENLMALRDSLCYQEKYAILQTAAIVFVKELMGPTDISAVTDGNFESRGALDLMMRMPWETQDISQGLIDSVTMEGTIKDSGGVTINTDTITITSV